MTLIASRYELAETIAEIINLYTLELYRGYDQYGFSDAKLIDQHLQACGQDITDWVQDAESHQPPDRFEEWLLEKQVAEQLPEDTEENTTVAPIDPDAERRDKGRTPIDGGDPDNQPAIFNDQIEPAQSKESNESPTTEKPVSEPKKTRVDNVSGSPVSGGDPDTSNIKRDPIADQLEAWLLAEGLTPYSAGNVIGISGQSITNILNGTSAHPSKKSLKKIRTAIRTTTKPKKKQVAEPEKLNGSRNLGPAQFLQMKLTAWMEAEHIGISEAAGRLMVQESALRSIKAHLAVHPNIVRQLCRYIPAIQAEQTMLIAAAEQQEAA